MVKDLSVSPVSQVEQAIGQSSTSALTASHVSPVSQVEQAIGQTSTSSLTAPHVHVSPVSRVEQAIGQSSTSSLTASQFAFPNPDSSLSDTPNLSTSMSGIKTMSVCVKKLKLNKLAAKKVKVRVASPDFNASPRDEDKVNDVCVVTPELNSHGKTSSKSSKDNIRTSSGQGDECITVTSPLMRPRKNEANRNADSCKKAVTCIDSVEPVTPPLSSVPPRASQLHSARAAACDSKTILDTIEPAKPVRRNLSLSYSRKRGNEKWQARFIEANHDARNDTSPENASNTPRGGQKSSSLRNRSIGNHPNNTTEGDCFVTVSSGDSDGIDDDGTMNPVAKRLALDMSTHEDEDIHGSTTETIETEADFKADAAGQVSSTLSVQSDEQKKRTLSQECNSDQQAKRIKLDHPAAHTKQNTDHVLTGKPHLPQPLLFCHGEALPAEYSKIILSSFNSYFSQLYAAQNQVLYRIRWGEPIRCYSKQPSRKTRSSQRLNGYSKSSLKPITNPKFRVDRAYEQCNEETLDNGKNEISKITIKNKEESLCSVHLQLSRDKEDPMNISHNAFNKIEDTTEETRQSNFDVLSVDKDYSPKSILIESMPNGGTEDHLEAVTSSLSENCSKPLSEGEETVLYDTLPSDEEVNFQESDDVQSHQGPSSWLNSRKPLSSAKRKSALSCTKPLKKTGRMRKIKRRSAAARLICRTDDDSEESDPEKSSMASLGDLSTKNKAKGRYSQTSMAHVDCSGSDENEKSLDSDQSSSRTNMLSKIISRNDPTRR